MPSRITPGNTRNKLTKDAELRQEFKLEGEINHECHFNLAQGSEDVEIEDVLEQMTLSDQPSTPIANPERKIDSKGKRHADQLIIKTNDNAKGEPVLAIEYKLPHTHS